MTLAKERSHAAERVLFGAIQRMALLAGDLVASH